MFVKYQKAFCAKKQKQIEMAMGKFYDVSE